MEAHRSRPPSQSRSSSTELIGLWLAWWVALFILWLLLVDTVEAQELLVGAIAASVAAGLAIAVHREGYMRFRPRARWLREAPWLAWEVIADCGLLAGALWRKLIGRQQVHGVTIRVPFHHGGDGGRDGARRALVNFAVSLTPNSYVVDIDPEADSLLVHRLVAGPLDGVLRREQDRAERSLPLPIAHPDQREGPDQ
jgi:multisubunit Na+/H+ antiporter MnhE subunit